MKVRNGFVSNSSSSSFVIKKSDLSQEEINKIINHVEEGKEDIEFATLNDKWDINVTKYEVRGSTGMDNFDMERFFNLIGIDKNIVEWDY